MKLGIMVGSMPGTIEDRVRLVQEAETLGFDSAWTSEGWGRDAVSHAAWLLASTSRINVGTAIMADAGSYPRHGRDDRDDLAGNVRWALLDGHRPIRTSSHRGLAWGCVRQTARGAPREYVSIIRQVLGRTGPLEHHGEHYDIPNTGPGTTGLGKPLKTTFHPDPDLRIFTGSFTPAGIRTAAEVADGVLPIFMNPSRFEIFADDLEQGFAKAGGGKSLENFDIAPFCRVIVNDDLQAARDGLRDYYALYVGGMGARGKNFYNNYVASLGYEGMAREVQDLFLGGNKREAGSKIQDRFIDEVALVGPPARNP